MTQPTKRPLTLPEAEMLKATAEAEKLQAEAEAARAEARKSLAIAQKEEYYAESARISRDSALRTEKLNLSGNHYHHEFEFVAPVHEDSVAACLAQLAVWHREDPECDMHIIMNSPGGTVVDGLHMFDQLAGYSLREWDTSDRPKGTHRTTVTARGYCASMAGILLQAADRRRIGPESFLMIHQVSSWADGSIGEIQDKVKFLDKVSDRIVDIFLRRAGGKIDREKFVQNWDRQDWWLTSSECLELGLVDEIG